MGAVSCERERSVWACAPDHPQGDSVADYRIKHADGRIEGPISGSRLRALAEAGTINADTRIQQVGRTTWHRAGSVPALAGILPGQGIAPGTGPVPLPPPPGPLDFSPVDGAGADELTLDIPEPPQTTPSMARGPAPSAPPPSVAPSASVASLPRDSGFPAAPAPAVVAQEEKSGLGDRILRATFQFARSISVLVIIASILVVLGGAALGTYALLPSPPGIGSGVDEPTIEEFVADCKPPAQPERGQRQARQRPKQDSLGEVDDCAPYRERVETAVSNLKLTSQATNIFCRKAAGLEARYRDPFLDGLVRMSDEYATSPPKGDDCSGADAANWYMREFDERVALDKAREQAAAAAAVARRSLLMPALTAIGAAIAALLIFLILPLLIQIERNTRAAA